MNLCILATLSLFSLLKRRRPLETTAIPRNAADAVQDKPMGSDTSDRTSALARNARGLSLRLKDELEPALTEFTRAIDCDSSFAVGYFNRGLVNHDRRQFDAAIADFDKAIALLPDLAGAYNARGNAYASKKNFPRAIADYTSAIRVDPDFSVAYLNRGFVLLSVRRFVEATRDLHQASRIDPKWSALCQPQSHTRIVKRRPKNSTRFEQHTPTQRYSSIDLNN